MAFTAHYTFEAFIRDNSNRLAFDRCKSLCNSKEKAQFFWLYGPSGCGKTHLLRTVYNNLCGYGSEYSCALHNAEEATEMLIEFLAGETNSWIHMQSHNCLLIDNVEYFLGRPHIQDEFADMILRMLSQGSNVVIASLCQPTELKNLYDSLVNQVEGLPLSTVAIGSLCHDTKLSIAESFLQSHPFDISDQTLNHFIESVDTVIQLKGILNIAQFINTSHGVIINEKWLDKHIGLLGEFSK